jgi:hypothetical protein
MHGDLFDLSIISVLLSHLFIPLICAFLAMHMDVILCFLSLVIQRTSILPYICTIPDQPDPENKTNSQMPSQVTSDCHVFRI